MKKKKRVTIQEGAAATNRWGCGCAVLALLGLIVAMMAAALMQS